MASETGSRGMSRSAGGLRSELGVPRRGGAVRPQPLEFRWRHLPIYLVLVIGAIVAMTPFLVMISQSLMTLGETLVRKPWPDTPQWGNFARAWFEADFDRYFRNSVIITATIILGVLITCTLAGYAFARIRFPGREAIFALLLTTMMIPTTVTFIPSFLLVRGNVIPWGSWLNTLPALTVPFVASAFIIFLLRQFFSQIPHELWDAARMDGAGHFRFLTAVVVPMSRPVLVTATLLTFINAWNEFMWPLLVTTNATWRPLSVGLNNFLNDFGPQTHLLMAASLITIAPVLLLYFFTQRQFTEGIATSGMKG